MDGPTQLLVGRLGERQVEPELAVATGVIGRRNTGTANGPPSDWQCCDIANAVILLPAALLAVILPKLTVKMGSLSGGDGNAYACGMPTVSGTYESELRCKAVHVASGSELITDAPVDNQGLGRTFSPTDLVAAAMGTCMMTIMGIWARRHGVDLAGTTFSVDKRMSADAPRRIVGLDVRFDVATPLDAEQKARLEQMAKACPVHHSIHPDIECKLTFDWRD